MKNMIKFLKIFAILVLIGFGLISCGYGGTKPCTIHYWGWKLNTIDATCTEASKDTAVCKNIGCNAKNERIGSINALGHKGINAVAATCTTDGNTGIGNCTRAYCGQLVTGEKIDALGHDESGAAATCMTAKMCVRSGCDYELQAELGHDESGAATCTTTKICARSGCDHELQDALGHDESGTAETCTTEKICARSGCDYEIEAALGHLTWIWSSYDNLTGKVNCTRDGCAGDFAKIGDTGPGGGKIFYVADGGGSPTRNPFTVQGYSGGSGTTAYLNFDSYTAYYLEAAPMNISGTQQWTTNSTDLILNLSQNPTNQTDWVIGRGRLNTAIIIARGTNFSPPYTTPAATACRNLPGNDWFLPSKNELNELWLRRLAVGVPSSGNFWSSSQVNNVEAWGQGFNTGDQSNGNKDYNWTVRAIRAF